MNTFKEWLLSEDTKDRFVGILSDGLGIKKDIIWNQLVSNFNPEKLETILSNYGEFTTLPQETQNRIMDKIRLGDGSLGDIINMVGLS